MKDNYIDTLIKHNWLFKNNDKIIDRVQANNYAENKLEKVDDSFFSFINEYKLLTNESDDVWFIPINEYSIKTKDEDEFSWNDFEIESLEYADDEDEKKEITNFWNNHLPFLFSVKDGYSYIALIIDGENKGKIAHGREPEYEDIEIVSDSFDEFRKSHIAYLKDGKQNSFLSNFL